MKYHHKRYTPVSFKISQESSDANTPTELTNIVYSFQNILNQNQEAPARPNGKEKQSPIIFKNRHIQEVLLNQYEARIQSRMPKPIKNQLLFSCIKKNGIPSHPVYKDRGCSVLLNVTGKGSPQLETYSRINNLRRIRLPSIYQSVQNYSYHRYQSNSRNDSMSMEKIMSVIAYKMNAHRHARNGKICLSVKKCRSHTLSSMNALN